MANPKNQQQTGDTNNQDTNAPAQPPPAPPAVDPREAEIAALRTQLDQVLDGMIAQQDEIAALKAAQTGAAATAVDQNDAAAELDAELEALKREFKDYPLIEVFDRRALVGLDANLDIRLKGEPSVIEDSTGERCYWKLRWFNFGKEGRAQAAGAEAYEKVRWDELADQESIATGARIDDYVRKGDRGLEVLHKIPRKLYDYKKRRDAARQSGVLSSERGLRDRLASQVSGMVASRGGNADQAGSFVHGKAFNLTITPGKTERFTP